MVTFFVLIVVFCGLAAPAGGLLAAQRDVLRVGVSALPPDLDPAAGARNDSSRILWNVFDTLIRMNPDDNSKLEPELALSWERVSDTTLELRLRPGVRFHNGDPFTSADVKFSFERVLDPTKPFTLARSLLAVVDRIETPDPLTVRVITREPDPVLEYRLASYLGARIVPERYVREVGDDVFARHPVGTGPFKVVTFSPNEIVLEAFDGFWGEQPNARRVIYREIPEPSGRIAALVSNEVDIINAVPPDLVPMVTSYNHLEVVSRETLNMHMLAYNTGHPVLRDRRLRQALNLAIDRDLIVETVWHGYAIIPRSYQSIDFGQYYDPDWPAPEYNLEKAKQLVAESGYRGETLFFDLIPHYYDNDVQVAEILTEMWKEAGVNVQIRFTTRFWENSDRAIHTWSNSPRFPDPVGGLWLLWGEESQRQRGDQSDWVDPNPRFNELGRELASSLDPIRRRVVYREMLAIWEEDAPGTILWQPALLWGKHKDVNWRPHRGHTMDFRAENLSFR